MKYFVITTKHHEGFCLWDSQFTDYKAPNTPAQRDLLTPMVQAFRERNLRVGFYHSLIDWHHPQFTIDSLHSLRNHPQRDQLNQSRDQSKYIAYLHGQVRELLTQFGPVDILWFDFSYPSRSNDPNWLGKGCNEWGSEDLVKLIRSLQPKVILDDRLDLPGVGDVKTPEQFQPRTWPTVNGQRVVWEACQTFSGSWGYHRDELTWRSTDELLRTLIDCVSKGGNLLLNVGPTGRGEFDSRALDRLQGIGQWMRQHSRAIYGCTQAPDEFACPRDCRLTYNPDTNRLYLHLLAWPYKFLFLEGKAYADRVEYAQLLHDASEIQLGIDDWHKKHADLGATPCVSLQIPQVKPDVAIPVIELFLK